MAIPNSSSSPASSNSVFALFCEEYGAYYPEELSSYGLQQFDNRTLHLENEQEEAEKNLINCWKKLIHQLQDKSQDSELEIDLKAFSAFLSRKEAYLVANQEHQIIPFYTPTSFIHDNIIPFLRDNGPASLSAVRMRLGSYLVGNCEEPSLFEMYKRRVFSLAKKYKSPLYPYRRQVNKYLENTTYYLESIKRHFIAAGFQGWEEVFQKLSRETKEYNDFIIDYILPYSRQSSELNPLSWYNSALGSHAISADPELLIETAKMDLAPLLVRWRDLGLHIATKYSLPDNDPVSVFAYFRNLASKDPKEISAIYENARKEIDNILKTTRFFSLPSQSRLIIRIGSPLESKTVPYPDLRVPKLLRKEPQEIEFVLPDPRIEGVGDEDYCLPAALSLLVHEGWPGHAYHIQRFQEHSFSDIRKSFLFSSALAEGWAVYGECTLLEHLPIEAQFITLQTLIWRCCRMLIEPQLYMRHITSEKAMAFLQETVGISAATAQTELDRYTFLMPGQAPCYYYGYKKIADLRNQKRITLGESFSPTQFHKELIDRDILDLFA